VRGAVARATRIIAHPAPYAPAPAFAAVFALAPAAEGRRLDAEHRAEFIEEGNVIGAFGALRAVPAGDESAQAGGLGRCYHVGQWCSTGYRVARLMGRITLPTRRQSGIKALPRQRIAAQLAQLDPAHKAEAMARIDSVSESDATDAAKADAAWRSG